MILINNNVCNDNEVIIMKNNECSDNWNDNERWSGNNE